MTAPLVYPSVRLILAHPSRVFFDDAPPERLILHITDGRAERARDTATNLWTTPATKDDATAASLVIGRDLAVVQCVPDLRLCRTWHAHEASRRSIGIEVQARGRGELGRDDPGMPVTPPQLALVVDVCAWLCAELELDPVTAIDGHAHADPATTHRDCPGACLDVGEVVRRVARAGRACGG